MLHENNLSVLFLLPAVHSLCVCELALPSHVYWFIFDITNILVYLVTSVHVQYAFVWTQECMPLLFLLSVILHNYI